MQTSKMMIGEEPMSEDIDQSEEIKSETS